MYCILYIKEFWLTIKGIETWSGLEIIAFVQPSKAHSPIITKLEEIEIFFNDEHL